MKLKVTKYKYILLAYFFTIQVILTLQSNALIENGKLSNFYLINAILN